MALMNFRKQSFLGRTDTYLTQAISGLAVFDPMRDYFSQHRRDDTVTRLMRYHRNWRFYNGEHYALTHQQGEEKFRVNYCRAIPDKSTDWLMSRGFSFTGEDRLESAASIVNAILKLNDLEHLAWRAGQVGSVSGDAYFYVSVPTITPFGQALPLTEQQIRVQALNSVYVHPKFYSSEDRTIVKCLIQYPVETRNFAHLGVPQSHDMGVYSVYMDGNEIREYVNEYELEHLRRPNVLGMVPIAHAQNLPHPGFHGLSDLDDIVAVQQEINEVSHLLREIVKYHAEPTTVIFGAKARDLMRGANKVWSNLPTDARIENIRLDASLHEILAYKEDLKLALHELSGTPESSLGRVQPISNTSAAAMEASYMPLIEKTGRKRITYGRALKETARIILAYVERYFGVSMDELGLPPVDSINLDIDWPSPLPRDEDEIVNREILKLQNALTSESEALYKIYGEESASRAIRILADRRERMMRDAENVRASSGETPNIAVSALGSLGMLPEVAEAFEEQDRAMREEIEEQIETTRNNLGELMDDGEGEFVEEEE